MRMEILMVTFAKDAPFAAYALQSIRRFCTGFGGVTVVVPNADVELFRKMDAPAGTVVKGFHEPEGKGMLAHMACKMEADIWCPQAHAILHLDADTIFWEDCTPDDFLVDGKPVLYREKFENFKQHAARYSWKECARRATGIDPEWECMVRHPIIHLTPTYGLTRRLITNHVGMDWKQWWMQGNNSFPQSRAEFPTLGAVAIDHASDRYSFVDWSCAETGNNYIYERGRDKAIALWSHGGLDDKNDRHPGRTAREVIEGILG
jgi:hypothetical protein